MAEPAGNADEIAELYNEGLALEKAGDFDGAAALYRKLLEIDPADKGGVSVRLASMGLGDVPDRAPEAYVETLFDQHAEDFDDILVEQLGYAVPLQLRQQLQARTSGRFGRILDLGCGTGLTGGALREMGDYIAGIDIAENMVELAYERDVYDDLYVGEALCFVEQDEGGWDLIAATDVMPYLGDLEPLVTACFRCLADGGYFAFSTETLAEVDFGGRKFTIGRYQRFAHRETYLRDLLAKTGFEIIAADPITVRHEQGAPIPGHLVLARKTTSRTA